MTTKMAEQSEETFPYILLKDDKYIIIGWQENDEQFIKNRLFRELIWNNKIKSDSRSLFHMKNELQVD